MPNITISGTVVNFPDSAQSPDWSSSIIQFATLVASALSLTAGSFDVPPQVYTMVSNTNTNVSLPNLSFPTAQVRAAFINYAVYRTTSLTNAAETGLLIAVYNPNGLSGSKWELTKGPFEGNAQTTFSMTDTGQIQFSSVSLTGANHVGTISYSAKTLLQA